MIKYLEALEKMADGRATKIFMPIETSGILSSAAAFGEMFKDGKEGKFLNSAEEKEDKEKDASTTKVVDIIKKASKRIKDED